MKQKQLLIGFGIVAIVIIGGGLFFLSQKSSKVVVEEEIVEDVIPTIAPQDLGISLEIGSDRSCLANSSDNQIRVVMENTKDITHIGWVVEYEADIPKSEQVEGSTGKVGQSFENEAKITPGEPFTSKYGLFGTCSKNVCRCDTGVENINVIFKITKLDGKVYQSQQSTSL